MRPRTATGLGRLVPRIATLDTRTALPAAKKADPFYGSKEWQELRAEIVRRRGPICQNPQCGRRATPPIVDHIVEIEDGGEKLDPANLQVLCNPCNTKKGLAARTARMARRTVL